MKHGIAVRKYRFISGDLESILKALTLSISNFDHPVTEGSPRRSTASALSLRLPPPPSAIKPLSKLTVPPKLTV
jgi:hypothetical protein